MHLKDWKFEMCSYNLLFEKRKSFMTQANIYQSVISIYPINNPLFVRSFVPFLSFVFSLVFIRFIYIFFNSLSQFWISSFAHKEAKNVTSINPSSFYNPIHLIIIHFDSVLFNNLISYSRFSHFSISHRRWKLANILIPKSGQIKTLKIN